MNAKFKKWIWLMGVFTLLFCATIAVGQNNQMIKASSNYKTKEIKIENFDQIKLLGSPTIVYRQSTRGKSELKIVGSDNLLDVVECEVSNNLLTVKYRSNVSIQFGLKGKLEILVSSPSLKSVQLQGSGDVIIENKLQCADLFLKIQGSGDIKGDKIDCTNDFSTLLQGSGDIVIENGVEAAKATLKLRGSGDLKVNKLIAKSATVSMQGSGDIEIKDAQVSDKVEALLAGSGDVTIEGIRTNFVTAKLQGSGDMNLRGVTRQATLTLLSSGSMHAKELKAKDVEAHLTGSGSITCAASGKLNCNTAGSGRISYLGTPSQLEVVGKNKPRKL